MIPPAFFPVQISSFMKCSGTFMWISLSALIRWKSIWARWFVAGSRCTDFSTAWLSSPPVFTVRMWAANASFASWRLMRFSSIEIATASLPPP